MLRLTVMCVLLVSLLSAQNPDTLNNAIVIRMVAAGVPPATIVRTIDAAPSVAFSFLPGDLSALGQANVPEEVVKAMAARSNRVNPPPTPTQVKSPVSPPASAAATVNPTPQGPKPAPRIRTPRDPSDEYQGRGMWDVNFQGSVSIPHASASAYNGFAEGSAGYFVASKSEIGFAASGIFLQPLKDIVLGGYYRQYLRSGRNRVIPFVGAAAGSSIIHVSGFGTQGNFAAIGETGLRMFLAKHVAVEVGYKLVYVHVDGAGFKDSSLSQVSFGFAHVFGR
jgi:hypothetical protein